MDNDAFLDLEEMLPVSAIERNGTVVEHRKVKLESAPEAEPEPDDVVIANSPEPAPEKPKPSAVFVEKINLDDPNLRALVVQELPEEHLELEVLHRCFICQSRFRTIDPMRHHLKIHAKAICLKCGEKFYTVPELDWHRRAIHGHDFEFRKQLGSMYFCRVCCSVGFLSLEDACEHLSHCHAEYLDVTVPKEDPTLYAGSKGDQTFLVCSESADPESWQYFCSSCDVFITGDKFNDEHIEFHRNPEPIRKKHKLECPHCDESPIFSHLEEFKEHMKSHTYQKIHDTRFYCLLCQRRFDSESGIRRHIYERHVRSTFPVPCPYCREQLPDAKAVAKHTALVHRILSPFTCESCGQKFSSGLERNRHRRQEHKSELEYRQRMCRPCFKLFETVEERQKHVEEVHGKDEV